MENIPALRSGCFSAFRGLAVEVVAERQLRFFFIYKAKIHLCCW